MKPKQPTIKGLFVNAHIREFRKAQGEPGIRKLRERYGKHLIFKSLEDVPIAEEVKILDCIVCILHGTGPKPQRDFESGRLHCRNFLKTPMAKLVFAQSKISLKSTFLLCGAIASRIFSGIKFESEDLGKQTVEITVKNCAYPIEHFQGFFTEWLAALGYIGSAQSRERGRDFYEYTIDWHE